MSLKRISGIAIVVGFTGLAGCDEALRPVVTRPRYEPSRSRVRVESDITSSQPLPFVGVFEASGYMGDAIRPGVLEQEQLVDSTGERVHRWTYSPNLGGRQLGWAAVAWQHPANNWGESPGLDLSEHRFSRVAFRARVVEGRARLILKSGGTFAPGARHRDSFAVHVGGLLELDHHDGWSSIQIPIEGHDLTGVISPLTVVWTRWANPQGCVVEIRELRFE